MDKYQPEEEHPRPEYIARLHGVEEKTVNFVTQTTEPRVPFWSRKFPGWSLPLVPLINLVALILYSPWLLTEQGPDLIVLRRPLEGIILLVLGSWILLTN